jgi:SAM-dependent methyltransferase
MDSDDTLTAIEMAEAMASPGPPSWNSPLDDDDQRTYMAALVEAYAADELARAEEQNDQYRIGDIGCGDGTFARDLATYYDSADYPETTVIGVDRSRKHAHAATYDQENAIAVGADAGELLPYLDDLDFAYAVNVLQDDPSLLEPLADTVDYLVATVPNTEGIPHEVSKADSGALRYDTGVDLPYLVFDEMAVDGVEMTMHQYVFPQEQMHAMFDDAGFTVLAQETLETGKESVNDMRAAIGLEPVDDPEPETVDLYILENEEKHGAVVG